MALTWHLMTCPGCEIEHVALDGARLTCKCGSVIHVNVFSPLATGDDLDRLSHQ